MTITLKWILFATLATLLACSDRAEEGKQSLPPQKVSAQENPGLLNDLSLHAWALGSHHLQANLDGAADLQKSVDTFLRDTRQETLDGLRAQWQQSHQNYQRASIFLAIGESNPGLFGHLQSLSNKLDAWPIQPGFLDSYDVYSHSGIVNDISLPINAEAIRAQHGISDDSDVVLGYHGMEYLLWGETGQRPLSELSEARLAIDGEPGLNHADLPQNRRRTLLRLQAQLLLDDSQRMLQHWQFPKGQLKSQYQSLPAASRFKLLQAAAAHLLQNQILPLLEQEAAEEVDASGEFSHNRFAGQNIRIAEIQLNGLADLFSEPSLMPRLLENSQQDEWAQGIEALQQSLSRAQKLQESEFMPALSQALNILEPELTE